MSSKYRCRKVENGKCMVRDEYRKSINTKGPNGHYRSHYGSYHYLVKTFPHSYKNSFLRKQKVVLFTGYNNDETWWKSNQLWRPWPSLCLNCLLLQCFLDGFLESENITKEEGHKLFKFGGGEQLKSKMFCWSLWNYRQRCYSWM